MRMLAITSALLMDTAWASSSKKQSALQAVWYCFFHGARAAPNLEVVQSKICGRRKYNLGMS